MKITQQQFGVLSSGQKIYIYTLDAGDVSLSMSNFGASLLSLILPSHKKEKKDDIILGYPSLENYLCNDVFLGVTVGRFANRIKNAEFYLNNKQYILDKNDNEHCLHGGKRGFGRAVWKADAYKERDGVFLRFELTSPNGDEGFPGRLKAVVSYGLTKSHEVIASYRARVNALSPVNITNHAYFNLAGEGNGDILSHELTLHSSSYVEVDKTLLPTGELKSVEGTPFDFRERKPIKRDYDAVEGGYDHCFAVDGEIGELRPCAEVFEEKTGRTMRVFTTQPGVQFYSGNFLNGVRGKSGSVYNKNAGFCLETQHFPDSPNQPKFPSAIFGPKRHYHEKAIFAFDW